MRVRKHRNTSAYGAKRHNAKRARNEGRSGPSICSSGTQFGNADFYNLQLRALGIIDASMSHAELTALPPHSANRVKQRCATRKA